MLQEETTIKHEALWLEELLSENTPINKRYHILLQSLEFLKKVETFFSYAEMLQQIALVLVKNIMKFEEQGVFSEADILEYVQKYRLLLREYRKYQVWLLGEPQDCNAVRRILDYDKVHLLGVIQEDVTDNHYDYVIVCSVVADLDWNKENRKVNFGLLRMCAWGLSPESAYLDIKIRKKLETGIQGVVTGLSYHQRGINFEKIERDFVCLATPSQDLFLDYQKFLWLYNDVVVRRGGTIKYCIIGMDFYRLWYDLSLAEQKIRMLTLYERHRSVHHFHEMDKFLVHYEEDLKICNEIMVTDYMDIDYCNVFQPDSWNWRNDTEYVVTDGVYNRDSEEVRRVFDKPYLATFEENVSILERFIKFLFLHDIKILVYIPPFPPIFNDFTNVKMKETTLNVLAELRKVYSFDILDLSDNQLFADYKYFADWSHLNANGADLATRLLNQYMKKIWG